MAYTGYGKPNSGFGGGLTPDQMVQMAQQAKAKAEAGAAAPGAPEGGVPTEPEPGSVPPETLPPPAPAPPKPPLPGGTSATPLAAGSFALPGSEGAAPFRSLNFLQNRFVSGAGGEGLERPLGAGSEGGVLGGAGFGAEDSTRPSEEDLRQLFAGILGRRGGF